MAASPRSVHRSVATPPKSSKLRASACAPGFIDVHTHDDTSVIETPTMLPKISQGVTTVIVGNCGISASPVRLKADPPDPMNLLGKREYFRYPTFAHYVSALAEARPSVNVAALIGHTALRNNHMDRLDRTANDEEIQSMHGELAEALVSRCPWSQFRTGICFGKRGEHTTKWSHLPMLSSARNAVYVTHMRTETDAILDAMDEAFRIGRSSESPVVISHLKCAGIAELGPQRRSAARARAGAHHPAYRL